MISRITRADIEAHRKWLSDEPDGKKLISSVGKIELESRDILSGADLSEADLSGADLSGADLSEADLSRADLSGADLSRANLSGADLSEADLSRADLSGADLSRANLSGADLSRADLSGADLSRADLSGADLSRADLSGANLSGADLSGAENAEWAMAITSILPEGDIIGWKQLRDNKICKLRIPATAKRSNASGRKCRAEYAEVLEIWDGETQVQEGRSKHDYDFVYRPGETVRPLQTFDDNRWEECASGIHFFISRLEAERY
jgi:hypothetical protein